MRMNNVEQTLMSYLTGDFYYRKNNPIRISQNGIITSQNTIIGYLYDGETNDGERYYNFLVLTMQNFKSQRNWQTHKKQLAQAANKQGYMVVFVPEIDIFMDCENNETPSSGNFFDRPYGEIYKSITKVAKYSQDEDLQTAALAIIDYEFADTNALLSYNQLIDGEYVHAEEVLCRWLDCTHDYDCKTFMMMLEPCVDCLKHMVDCGAEKIQFAALHKKKWTTTEFIDYTNDIWNKTILSNRGRPIYFGKVYNQYVKAFYKSKEAK